MKLFTQHPASVNESYVEHLFMASIFSLKLLLASTACFLHAIFPFMFERTGSHIITELNHLMIEKRKQKSD
jgi:hypothetical protein